MKTLKFPFPATIIRILLCILIASSTLYIYIDKQNDLTELRRMIPETEKEVRYVQEENIRLKYEIDQFESPVHLMELAGKPEYGHLKYPTLDKVVILEKEDRRQKTEE